MRFRGGNPAAKLTAINELPSKSHYFVGSDPQKWRTNVSQYARVKYEGVYPGIDVIFHGDQRQLEYDLVIAPGADPRVVRLEFEGGKGLRVDGQGDLVVRMKGGQEIRQLKPIIYQEVDGERRLIAGSYALRGRREVGFDVAAYDTTRPMVVDPILAYATYLGGNSPGSFGNGGTDVASAVAVDTQGNMYVSGVTNSIDYPVVNPIPGRPPGNPTFFFQGFLTKLNAAGIPVYSSFMGDAAAFGIAADGQGNAYLAGTTSGFDFPLTPNAFQTQYGDGTGVALETAFLMKVNPSGSGLLYSSYLGGSIAVGGSPRDVDDIGYGIAIDAAGNAYVAGLTSSADFPTTPGALQRQNPGEYSGFVAKINPALAGPPSLVYSTYLGGRFTDTAESIAVDREGNAFITGSTFSPDFPTTVNAAQRQRGGSEDAFVTELDGAGAVQYSTYLGGSGIDRVFSIALDPGRNAWVAGHTDSTNFPTTPNAAQPSDPDLFRNNRDAFVARIDPGLAGSASLAYSTYLGGSDLDEARGIACDGSGNVYVAGLTNSTNFPPAGSVPRFTLYVTKLDPTGAIVSSTGLRIGGTARGMTASDIGDVYVTGNTATKTGFATPGAFQPTYGGGGTDAFLAKLCDCDRPAILTPSVPTFPVGGNGWNMIAEVSERDGIVLRDVVLGTRYLAEKISVPYYSLKTVKDGQTFFEASASRGSGLELRPNDDAATVGASRLVDLKLIDPTEFYSPLVIEGTYLIDNISPQGKSCLRIAQRYEFYPAIDEDQFPDLACESSRTAPPPFGTLVRLFKDGLFCARFNPIVKYDLCAQEGETLESINIPERFHFQVEQPPPVSNQAAHLLIRDGDSQLSIPFTVISGNPFPNEIVQEPINFGFSNGGTADNFHQSYELAPGERIAEPFLPPGCPECVHIHWRWGQWHLFPQGLPPGRPVIPLGSNQSVQFGIVRAQPGEEHPSDGFERFANGEPAINTDNVFWYSATGHQAADAFFTHGLFFSPNYGRQKDLFAVLFADDANPGATTFTAIDPALAGQLPSGFTAFESTAIDISTPGPTGSGPIIVSVGVPTVDDPNVFSRLRVFHREGDALVDRTILPPDTPASDFEVRTLYARVDSLSPFVIALASDQPPSNRPPVARCKDVQVIAGNSCSASPTATDVDAGSSDPDGDPITLALSPAGPFGLGSRAVTLTAADPSTASSSCQATVMVLDQAPPTVTCPADKAVANDAGLCSATVDPGLPAATDACSAPSVVGVRSDGQSLTGAYPVGTTMITWTATDSSGNETSCAQRVAVADLQAPVISTVSVDNPTLWPPNHNMVDVAVTYDVADDCDAPAAMSCALGVVSNEPVDGLGDGDTAPDWEILDSHHVRLRSERAGSGTGRTYTISVTCGDSRDNSSARTVDVVVPKSQK
jgi:hypothetical protein